MRVMLMGTALIIGLAIWTRNILGIALLVVAIVSYLVVQRYGKTRYHILFDSDGLRIDHKDYSFEDFDSFWIFYDPPEVKELSLRGKNILSSASLTLPLDDVDPVTLREYLIRFIPEKKQAETLVQALVRMFQ